MCIRDRLRLKPEQRRRFKVCGIYSCLKKNFSLDEWFGKRLMPVMLLILEGFAICHLHVTSIHRNLSRQRAHGFAICHFACHEYKRL